MVKFAAVLDNDHHKEVFLVHYNHCCHVLGVVMLEELFDFDSSNPHHPLAVVMVVGNNHYKVGGESSVAVMFETILVDRYCSLLSVDEMRVEVVVTVVDSSH